MKKIIMASLFALVAAVGFGQETLTYTDVVSVEGIPQKELYNRAKIWLAETYNSAQDVIQMDDKEAGILIGHATMKFTSNIFSGSGMTKGYINYKIKISVKDNKYKYEFTDYIHKANNFNQFPVSFGKITIEKECPIHIPMTTKGWRNKVWKDMNMQINSNVTLLIESLNKKMTETTNNNW